MPNIIIGGGISGLSAAFYLSKSMKTRIKIFESTHRLGGWIKSSKKDNGTLFEHGPRTLRIRGIAGENTLALVKQLGLTHLIRAVPKTSEAAKKRMIYFNNQLITLPNSWTALFKIDPPFIKPFLFALYNDLRAPKKSVTDDSIYEFVARRFGKQYAETLLSSLTCGVFGGDAKEISVRALMNELFENEQKYGSVFRGILYSIKNKSKISVKKQNSVKSIETKNWAVWSLENGLETLPKEIGGYLENQKNVDIFLNKRCTKVEFKNGKALVTIDGKVEAAGHLYSALPSRDLANILEDRHPILKDELSAIPFVSIGVVNLEYEGDLLEKKGFGFLVPPNQNIPILGVIFDSCIFPQEGKTVLTVMMGGKWFDHYFGSHPSEEMFLKTAQDHIRSILKINEKPSNCMVMILRDCIPQYVVGHSERILKIREYIKANKLPLTLTGNSYDGVSVNEAIMSAKTGVENNLRNIKL